MRHFRLIFSAILLMSLAPVFAQRVYDPHFSLGGKAGVTFSNMAFTPSIEQSMIQGISIGAVARYTEEKFFGIVAEFNIEQRGWKETFDETAFTYQRRLTYLQLPVMTHIYFGSHRMKGFVNLGPSVGYMIADGISSNFDYRNPASVEGFPIANRHINQMAMDIKKRFDYGICAGAGIEITFRRKHSFLLEGRYYYGLGNIFSAKKADEFSASRGTSIQVAFGYMFHLK